MSQRNFKQELCYSSYIDMEYGNDKETIDYRALIGVITELVDRIEKLERWQTAAQKSARIVKQTLDAKDD